MSNTDRIILSYIPRREHYKPLYRENDSYLNSKIFDLEQLEKRFRWFKYNHKNANSMFFLIRDPEVAAKLGISQDGLHSNQ